MVKILLHSTTIFYVNIKAEAIEIFHSENMKRAFCDVASYSYYLKTFKFIMFVNRNNNN